MPVVQRLDMVLQYTHRDRVLQFENGLNTWEKAAATVQLRETLMSQYSKMKQVCVKIKYAGMWVPGRYLVIIYQRPFSSGHPLMYNIHFQGLSNGLTATFSIDALERLCCALIHANCQIEALAAALRDEYGSALVYKGVPYPSEPLNDVVPDMIRIIREIQEYNGPCKILP